MKVKQVIVIRKDLKMRRGKEIAQGAHASLCFLINRISGKLEMTPAMNQWLVSGFAKITCRVDSEQELLDVYNKAKDKKLEVHLITDSGKTEFGGTPTNTALAIGPDYSDRIDEVTGSLELY